MGARAAALSPPLPWAPRRQRAPRARARARRGAAVAAGSSGDTLYGQGYSSDGKYSASNTPWPDVHVALVAAGVESLGVEEARAAATAKSVLLIDVRELESYEEGHAEGAVSVPLYVRSDEGGLRAAAFAALPALGGAPTVVNARFVEEAAELLDTTGATLALMCETGGKLSMGSYSVMGQSVPKTGERSRSLEAIYMLINAGVPAERLAHVRGGVRGWRWAKLPEMAVVMYDSDSDDE